MPDEEKPDEEKRGADEGDDVAPIPGDGTDEQEPVPPVEELDTDLPWWEVVGRTITKDLGGAAAGNAAERNVMLKRYYEPLYRAILTSSQLTYLLRQRPNVDREDEARNQAHAFLESKLLGRHFYEQAQQARREGKTFRKYLGRAIVNFLISQLRKPAEHVTDVFPEGSSDAENSAMFAAFEEALVVERANEARKRLRKDLASKPLHFQLFDLTFLSPALDAGQVMRLDEAVEALDCEPEVRRTLRFNAPRVRIYAAERFGRWLRFAIESFAKTAGWQMPPQEIDEEAATILAYLSAKVSAAGDPSVWKSVQSWWPELDWVRQKLWKGDK